jgi:hypothetical protein
MRNQCAVFLLSLLAACYPVYSQTMTAPSFVTASREDEAAVRAIVAMQSADQIDPRVAADLDWENAFGIRYTSLAKRNAFYSIVVKPQMKDANDSTLEVKVKFIEPTVAIADEYWHVAGQVYAGDTKPGPDRWGRTTYIFKKENGAWTEVIERVADLRIAYFKHYETMPKAVSVPAEILASYAGIYDAATGKKFAQIEVSGDHLAITTPRGKYTAIPTSDTDFLSFNPDDLAEYYKASFKKESDGSITLTVCYATGEILVKTSKAK